MGPRLDPEQCDVIEERADALGVAFSFYLGTIFDIAAGNHPRASSYQPSLLHVPDASPFADRPDHSMEVRVA